jgi:hypothetical protein
VKLGEFVRPLAHRITGFPAAGRAALKDRINAISLPHADEFRRDSDLFLKRARDPETPRRTGPSVLLKPLGHLST